MTKKKRTQKDWQQLREAVLRVQQITPYTDFVKRGDEQGRAVINGLAREGLVRRVMLHGRTVCVAPRGKSKDVEFLAGYCLSMGVRDDHDGCLTWPSRVSQRRGPMVRFGGDERPVRRLVYAQSRNRKLKPKDCIVMTCDNPQCIEPGHMRCTTRAQLGAGKRNAATRLRLTIKRRERSSVTAAMVDDMRCRYEQGGVSLSALAKEHGLSPCTVKKIVQYQTWRPIEANPFVQMLMGATA